MKVMVEEKKVRGREVPVTANLKTRHSEGLTGPVRRIEEKRRQTWVRGAFSFADS